MDLSTNCKVILVGYRSHNNNFIKMVYGITFMLAPKSAKAFLLTKSPIM